MAKAFNYAPAALALGTFAALAAAHPAAATPAYGYLTTIAVPGADGRTPAAFSGYDLSVFDPTNQLYYLTDRTNKGIDVFSAATNSYVTRIGAGLFAGSQGGNNDIAGPNGVYLSNTPTGKLLLAGNGASNVFAFNLDASGTTVVGNPRAISTAVAGTTPTPPNRVDGVAYAPGANTILAANNASNPGFVTLIDNASGSVIRTIKLDGTGGYPSVAANGVEATIYNTARNSFFVAVPTLPVGRFLDPENSAEVISPLQSETDANGSFQRTRENCLPFAVAGSPSRFLACVGQPAVARVEHADMYRSHFVDEFKRISL